MLHLILLARQDKNIKEAISHSPASLVYALICFFSFWSILGLSGFHTYLLSSNQTTNEDIKGTFNPKRRPHIENPYSNGSIISNCLHALCGPELPSLIDRRGFVEGDPEVVVTVDELDAVRWAERSSVDASAEQPVGYHSAQMNHASRTTISDKTMGKDSV